MASFSLKDIVNDYFASVDSTGAVKTNGTATVTGTIQPVGLQTAGRITMLAIDSTQWYEAPAVALTGRNNINIQNPATSVSNMIWNYSASAALTAGFQIPPGGSYSVAIKGSIPVYVTMASGSATVVVEELA